MKCRQLSLDTALTKPVSKRSLAAGATWTLVLKRVLAHLGTLDVASLRLTARAFRDHPAILCHCVEATMPSGLPVEQRQRGLRFLARLPKLSMLSCVAAASLHGLEQLSQLRGLEIEGCLRVLDLCPLAQLPLLERLELLCCPAPQVGNLADLSHLTRLTNLSICQDSFHSEVGRLTALRKLHILWAREDTPAQNVPPFLEHFPGYSSLTGLTSLSDNSKSRQHWHRLPCLRFLTVTSPITSPDLDAFTRLTNLCGLSLNFGLPGSQLTSLTPLTALLSLQRLDLIDPPLLVPPLASLSRLSLDYHSADGGMFPELAYLPKLEQICLDLYKDLELPRFLVSNVPALSTIYLNDDHGNLSMCVRDQLRYSLVDVIGVPGIDEGVTDLACGP